jgi:Tol biopolymer transport system component
MQVGALVASLTGKTVFFMGSENRYQVMRLDSPTGTFVPFLPGHSSQFADLARDGQLIAYTDSAREGTLWRCRAGGSEARQLTLPPMEVQLPRWSPDGKLIAFLGQKTPQDRWQAYVIAADGGECQPVLPSSYCEGAPTWSPDSTQVAFGELRADPARPPAEMRIHIVNLITHAATTLPGSEGLWTARWSTDGKRMAAITADSQTLMVFDFHTQHWQAVATGAQITDLNWSYKKDQIYFTDLLPPRGPAIFRVTLRDRSVEEVASLKGKPPIPSVWLGVTPDDSILVSRVVDQAEIYSLDWEAP